MEREKEIDENQDFCAWYIFKRKCQVKDPHVWSSKKLGIEAKLDMSLYLRELYEITSTLNATNELSKDKAIGTIMLKYGIITREIYSKGNEIKGGPREY